MALSPLSYPPLVGCVYTMILRPAQYKNSAAAPTARYSGFFFVTISILMRR